MLLSELEALHIERSGPSLIDLDIAKRAAEVLMRHYPGYLWAVNADSETGMVDIRCINLSGQYGYRTYMKLVQDDPEMREVKRAGGEILERYRQRRGRLDDDALADEPVDFRGAMRFDT